MNVETIKTAIEQLTQRERRILADWFEQMEELNWDAEMKRDFSSGGRGHQLVEKVDQEIDGGDFTPIEKGLRSRQEKQ